MRHLEFKIDVGTRADLFIYLWSLKDALREGCYITEGAGTIRIYSTCTASQFLNNIKRAPIVKRASALSRSGAAESTRVGACAESTRQCEQRRLLRLFRDAPACFAWLSLVDMVTIAPTNPVIHVSFVFILVVTVEHCPVSAG